ncbi:hypothetical protein ABMA28_012779 [Loxostege sticticalis]|uniref:Translation initiation factor eIF2B subunit beta n=1 Tax=Loxostege sticticalis TaxID=481309 RepID=A0ABD0S2S8_LOXSC
MSPLEGPTKELDEKYEEKVVKFVSDVRNGKIEGSNNIALATLSLLEQIIGDSENATAFELINVVRAAGRVICRALPRELVPANMVRRVLRAIRDEHRAHADQSGGTTTGGSEGAGESLQRLVLAAAARRGTLGAAQPDLREPLRDHIAEVRAELESSTGSICSQASEHVHADELILTCGHSRLLERFLKAAAARRNYKLIVAEGPDYKQSHAMAGRLSAGGVGVTLVSSASVAGVMSRVNKVILGVRATLSGGAVLAHAGAHAVAAAAKHYSVPVIALSPLYKLSPLHECDRHQLTAAGAPHHVLPLECPETGLAHVYAPRYDYLRPDHVSLFITSLGGSSPSYIYRLLSELYDPKDHQI